MKLKKTMPLVILLGFGIASTNYYTNRSFSEIKIYNQALITEISNHLDKCEKELENLIMMPKTKYTSNLIIERVDNCFYTENIEDVHERLILNVEFKERKEKILNEWREYLKKPYESNEIIH